MAQLWLKIYINYKINSKQNEQRLRVQSVPSQVRSCNHVRIGSVHDLGLIEHFESNCCLHVHFVWINPIGGQFGQFAICSNASNFHFPSFLCDRYLWDKSRNCFGQHPCSCRRQSQNVCQPSLRMGHCWPSYCRNR